MLPHLLLGMMSVQQYLCITLRICQSQRQRSLGLPCAPLWHKDMLYLHNKLPAVCSIRRGVR